MEDFWTWEYRGKECRVFLADLKRAFEAGGFNGVYRVSQQIRFDQQTLVDKLIDIEEMLPENQSKQGDA